MAQYSLAAGQFNATTLPKQIGQNYHVGISDGTRYYGYVLVPNAQQDQSYIERTDLHAKDQLTQYSSPNLIDRDFVNYPRVTDGDFSGGMLQTVFINPQQYYDSDLDTSQPGYVRLFPQWNRTQFSGGPTGNGGYVVSFYGGQLIASLFSSSIGSSLGIFNGGTLSTYTASPTQPTTIDTDGTFVYLANSSAIDRFNNAGTLDSHVATSVNGTLGQIWVVNLGTTGYRLYYSSSSTSLYYIDLTAALPVAAGSHVQVPMGASRQVVDLCQYQNGIAILTYTNASSGGAQVWYHDGANMTPIANLPNVNAVGMTNCLGNLYVSVNPQDNTAGQLLQITSGALTPVVNFITPNTFTSTPTVYRPAAGADSVYFMVTRPPNQGISSPSFICRYNVLTGATSHLPNYDANDSAGAGLRNLCVVGRSPVSAITYKPAATVYSYLQYWKTSAAVGVATAYQSSGWLVGSVMDFGTPSIVKAMRRITVVHAPLNSGEQVLVQAWVDKDPTQFTTTATQGSGPTQYTAQATNSTVGSTQTVLSLPTSTVGKTMFFAFQLTAGTSNLTTPVVNRVSVEIATPFAWEMSLDCTNSRRLLSQGTTDPQGVRGKDLAYLLRNAWENAASLTFYHFNGTAYTVDIESCEWWNPSPSQHQGQGVNDEEYHVKVLLRQSG